MIGTFLEQASIPLPLDMTRNTRDLGGYRTEDGRVTRHASFLRSDPPSGLTTHDIEFLETYEIGLVVDLRTSMEVSRAPDSDRIGIRYANYPLLDGIQNVRVERYLPPSMTDLYVGLLDESGATLALVFKEMVESDGCVLFHCTAGKDRTGLVAMLLLKLAKVPDDLVIADYAVSEHYMREVFEMQKEYFRQAGISVPAYVMESKPQTMRDTLDHLARRYGDSRGYLRHIGLDEQEIGVLAERLIG